MCNPWKSGFWDPNPEYILRMAVRATISLHVDYITMICIQLCSQNTIDFAAFNDTADYPSLHAPMEALMMFLSTHISTISSMIPILLNHTFQAYLTVCSQVRSEKASKYTPRCSQECLQEHSQVHFSRYSQQCSYLNMMVYSQPSMHICRFSRCPEAYFQACSQVCSQLHDIIHSQSTWLYTSKFPIKRQDTPNFA
jgi:hypothetical protein